MRNNETINTRKERSLEVRDVYQSSQFPFKENLMSPAHRTDRKMKVEAEILRLSE